LGGRSTGEAKKKRKIKNQPDGHPGNFLKNDNPQTKNDLDWGGGESGMDLEI